MATWSISCSFDGDCNCNHYELNLLAGKVGSWDGLQEAVYLYLKAIASLVLIIGFRVSDRLS